MTNNQVKANNSRKTINYVVKIAILAALSAVIMLLEFPLPFAPGFYKLDLSEAVILMGGFAMGPVAAAVIELIKNLINILLNGTTTAFVGEFANFLTGCALVVPAAVIYKYHKTLKGAIVSLAVGTISLVVVGSAFNYFVLIPAFASMYHMPLDEIISMGSKVNPLVSDLKTLVMFAVAPFNIVKGVLCSLINLLLYKRVSKVLHI